MDDHYTTVDNMVVKLDQKFVDYVDGLQKTLNQMSNKLKDIQVRLA